MDILISLDVILLFTNVPLKGRLGLIKDIFTLDKTEGSLSQRVTFSGTATFTNNLMDFNPIVANFHIEYFEQKAIKSSHLKPTLWYQ